MLNWLKRRDEWGLLPLQHTVELISLQQGDDVR